MLGWTADVASGFARSGNESLEAMIGAGAIDRRSAPSARRGSVKILAQEANRIRIRSLATVVSVLLLSTTVFAASGDPIAVLTERERRELTPVVRSDAEMLPLEPLIAGFGVTTSTDSRTGAITLRRERAEVTLYDHKSLVSVGGDLRLLSAPALQENGRWLVPADGVARFLPQLLSQRVEWRPAARVLLIGNVSIPQIGVTTQVTGERVRVVLEASEKVPFVVLQEPGKVTVSIPRDALNVNFQQQRLTGGIVDSVAFVGGREQLFTITLGRRFQNVVATEEENPTRLALEFQARAAGLDATGPSAPSPAPPRPVVQATSDIRTVVIDPGHGGVDLGAQGVNGAMEKDVTLAISRKLKALLVNNLGLQVFLTRDADRDLSLDDRTAFANNYKADLFISIHANASRFHEARGSEVYFLSYEASDDESRRVAQSEGASTPPDATTAPANADLAMILWEMAQAEHLEASSTLASRIQDELAEVTGSQGRGIKQAPFRVLVGATMPAVLIEVAFISHPAEEKLLVSDAYQSQVAAALTRGVARYQKERDQAGAANPAPRSGF
jgi:N-acetylmuramoyl-L-alanine amidase